MRLLSLVLNMLIPLLAFSQLKYAVVGEYKSQSAQGMAIWNDKAYLLNNTGICRIFNLNTETVVSSFLLDSYGRNNHANSASFGCEVVGGNSIPVIYVTECHRRNRCFVENIVNGKSYLVQTITATKDGKEIPIYLWTVDEKRKFLYGVTRDDSNQLDSLGNKVNTIIKYRLPSLNDGKEVVLTDKNIVDAFSVVFPNILQGGKVKGNYMYIASGLEESSRYRKDSKRAIVIINLKKKNIKRIIDLTKITVNEPEDIDFYKDYILLWCGQQGGLYKVKK